VAGFAVFSLYCLQYLEPIRRKVFFDLFWNEPPQAVGFDRVELDGDVRRNSLIADR
jgi:hypothetical protein